MSGPSKQDLAGHHLTEAIRHLYAAAEFARELDREDANDLAMTVERAAETARDVRGTVENSRGSTGLVKESRLEEGMRFTAQMMLDLLRKRVGSRRIRVLLFARAARVALDALPPEERGPGFVPRTWDLPELAGSTQEALSFISNMTDRLLTNITARAVLFSRATQLAIDDLSPDERIAALEEASQIIGTPPLRA